MNKAYEVYFQILGNKKEEKINCKYSIFIGGKDKLESLTYSIYDFFESLPRKYKIKIKFPSLTHSYFESKEICHTVRFEDIKKSQTGLSSLFNQFNNTGLYLCFDLIGYMGNNPKSKPWIEIQSLLQRIIIIGLYFNLFQINKNKVPVISYLSELITPRKEFFIDKAIIIDAQNEFNIYLDLPYDTSLLLYQVELTNSANNIDCLNKQFNHLKKIFVQLQKDDTYTEQINTAISWAYASYCTNNQTFSYIFTFLGLEALLGFKNPKEASLVDKIAIRCATLIGNSQKHRNEIEKKFKELYKIRSKLVHGSLSKLNTEHESDLIYAQDILKVAICKEISLMENNN